MFEFATATRIIFGERTRDRLPELAREFGTRVLLVAGSNAKRAEWLVTALRASAIQCHSFVVAEEPSVELVEAGAGKAHALKTEVVISLGGGSAIDAGKAIAALATNPCKAEDYLEVIGKALPLENSPLPFIAVPTTAGTGAEVTRNAVLSSKEHRVKVSLRSPRMLPAVALIDPELTFDLPPNVTAYTGLDALTQLIEPFLSSKANPLTDALCREALPLVARALPIAFHEPKHAEARREMALASLFGGLALANAGLGAVHGFAAPIGGMFVAPHGAICAALLPAAMAVNLGALKARESSDEMLGRYDELARMLTGNREARAEESVEWVGRLCSDLHVARLSSFGVGVESFDLLCERATRASSMKANPVELTAAELRQILQRSL